MQAKCGEQWNGKGSDLRTKSRNGLTDPEIAERSIDEEDRRLDKKGGDWFVETFHFGMPATTRDEAESESGPLREYLSKR